MKIIRMLISLAILAFMVLGCASCARLRTDQERTLVDGTSEVTRVRITTFWDSQSALAKLRMTGTEKTQGVTVQGYEAEATSTNLATIAEAIAIGVTKGLKGP